MGKVVKIAVNCYNLSQREKPSLPSHRTETSHHRGRKPNDQTRYYLIWKYFYNTQQQNAPSHLTGIWDDGRDSEKMEVHVLGYENVGKKECAGRERRQGEAECSDKSHLPHYPFAAWAAWQAKATERAKEVEGAHSFHPHLVVRVQRGLRIVLYTPPALHTVAVLLSQSLGHWWLHHST